MGMHTKTKEGMGGEVKETGTDFHWKQFTWYRQIATTLYILK